MSNSVLSVLTHRYFLRLPNKPDNFQLKNDRSKIVSKQSNFFDEKELPKKLEFERSVILGFSQKQIFQKEFKLFFSKKVKIFFF
jgi:hypothetical protein